MTFAVSRPTIRGSRFETDSSPRHKLQEDEPLRKAMISFLRTQLGPSGGELERGIGYGKLNQFCIGLCLGDKNYNHHSKPVSFTVRFFSYPTTT